MGNVHLKSLLLVLKIAAIFWVLGILSKSIQYYFDIIEKGIGLVGLAFIVLYFIVAIMLIKRFRDKELGGYITFGHAFDITLRSVIIAVIISKIFEVIYSQVILKEAFQNTNYPIERVTNVGISYAISRIIYCMLFSIVMGIIVGAICRKTPSRRSLQ